MVGFCEQYDEPFSSTSILRNLLFSSPSLQKPTIVHNFEPHQTIPRLQYLFYQQSFSITILPHVIYIYLYTHFVNIFVAVRTL
jgi:hypothetical protein